jgi:predicted amidohydrolase YtcJ
VFAHKAFVDGTLGSRTAWMLEPFEGGDDRGLPTLDPAALDSLASAPAPTA